MYNVCYNTIVNTTFEFSVKKARQVSSKTKTYRLLLYSFNTIIGLHDTADFI